MKKILLVEDNHLNREMFSRRLERKGFQVVGAPDGRDAVNKAHSETPDLILMDLSLPILDGWEATRQIKASPVTAGIPVIAMTAHAMVGDREKALEAGCNEYETKPVDLNRLLKKITALLPDRAPTPVVQERSQSTGPPSSSSGDLQLDAARVLVVDDNQMNREMLSRRLVREGYRVTLASCGSEAIDLISQHPFDLVLLDMMMPDMNGMEVLNIVRSSHALLELPVIVVTAKDQGDDMVVALKNGANDYVTKPFNFPVLLARLETQVSMKRSRQEGTARQPQFTAQGSPTARGSAVGAPPVPVGGSALLADTPAVVSTHSPAGGARSANRMPVGTRNPVRPGSSAGWSDSGRPLGSQRDTRGLSGSRSGDSQLSGRGLRGTQKQTDTNTPRWGSSRFTGSSQLAGYEILGELGRGGMGVVYKARHPRMDRVVALKVIDREHLTRPSAIQRFYREIRAAAQLSHRNIVLAFDAGEFEDTHYFAMEYVQGIDLRQLVKKQGPLPIQAACNFVLQAADGLQHASDRGMVHRDVKPSNLLITWDKATPQEQQQWQQDHFPPLQEATVKILDLGLALLYEGEDSAEGASGLTREGRVVGTADYMAPEQWMNAHKVDIRADLYSLGGTFYYLLTGKVPFPGDEPMEKMLKHHLDEPIPVEQLRPEVPELVCSVVRRMMAKQPSQRHQTPREVCDDLAAFSCL